MMKENIISTILITVLIVTLVIVMFLSDNSKSVIQKISPEKTTEIIQNEKVIIIDVRTKEEYKSSHIKNAINIPYGEIDKSIKYNKNQAVAVYCQTGMRSNKAAKKLEKMGYKEIYDLGGIENINVELTTD